ncbi:MAG TPA: hypothetical protein VJ757_09735 [Pseudonocardiaceae bacterium]|nr:hypothetical protein [Pseudonocardiaceae bacterium]
MTVEPLRTVRDRLSDEIRRVTLLSVEHRADVYRPLIGAVDGLLDTHYRFVG